MVQKLHSLSPPHTTRPTRHATRLQGHSGADDDDDDDDDDEDDDAAIAAVIVI